MKAYLEVDMPNDCYWCELSTFRGNGWACCAVHNILQEVEPPKDRRASFCPLKPVVERSEINE